MAKQARKKLKRYHRDVFFPDWMEESLGNFMEEVLTKGQVVFSVHSVDKIVSGVFEYGRLLQKYLLKSISRESLRSASPFEFYAIDREIRKVCFRFSYPSFPVDIVLVISVDGTVITLYTIHQGDNHETMNTSVYERR